MLRLRNPLVHDGLVNLHGVRVRSKSAWGGGLRLVILSLYDRRRRGWWPNIDTILSPAIGFLCGILQLRLVCIDYQALIIILNHRLRLGAHMVGDRCEIGAEVRDVFSEVLLLWD